MVVQILEMSKFELFLLNVQLKIYQYLFFLPFFYL